MKKNTTIQILLSGLVIASLLFAALPVDAQEKDQNVKAANFFDNLRNRFQVYKLINSHTTISNAEDDNSNIDIKFTESNINTDAAKAEQMKSRINDLLIRIDDIKSRFNKNSDLQEDLTNLREEFVKSRNTYESNHDRALFINNLRLLVDQQRQLEKKVKQDIFLKNLTKPLEALSQAFIKVNATVTSLQAKGFVLDEALLKELDIASQILANLQHTYTGFMNNPDSVTREDVDTFKQDIKQLKSNLQIIVYNIKLSLIK